MARSRYEFIKIELRLFDDPRYFMLSEFERLMFINLIVLAKRTGNYVKKDWVAIRRAVRTEQTSSRVQVAVDRIITSFQPEGNRKATGEPTIEQNKYYLWFTGWDERYEYHGVEKEKEKEKDKDKEEEKEYSSSKKKPYFKGEEMRFSKNKWWVMPKTGGSWLEFAGNEKEIEYK